MNIDTNFIIELLCNAMETFENEDEFLQMMEDAGLTHKEAQSVWTEYWKLTSIDKVQLEISDWEEFLYDATSQGEETESKEAEDEKTASTEKPEQLTLF